MKKYLLLLIPTLVYSAEYDIKKTLDLTGKTSVTGTTINQMVDTATVATNKGMIIVGASAPLVNTHNRYTNFLWLDTSVSPPSLKSWTTAGLGPDPNNSTNWASATVGTAAIIESKIADGAVTESKIGALAVSNGKLASNSVSQSKMQTDSVGPAQIQASAVENAELANGSITAAKIVDGEITANKYADSSITSNKIATGQITLDKLASLIGQTNLAANSIAQTNLQLNCVVRTNIGAGVITATNLDFVPMTNMTYVSSQIACPAAAGGLTNAHSLSGTPSVIYVVLVNQSAEHGYNPDDELNVLSISGSSYEQAFAISADATNVYIKRFNSTFSTTSRTDGSTQNLTDAKWKIKIRAYRFD